MIGHNPPFATRLSIYSDYDDSGSCMTQTQMVVWATLPKLPGRTSGNDYSFHVVWKDQCFLLRSRK